MADIPVPHDLEKATESDKGPLEGSSKESLANTEVADIDTAESLRARWR